MALSMLINEYRYSFNWQLPSKLQYKVMHSIYLVKDTNICLTFQSSHIQLTCQLTVKDYYFVHQNKHKIKHNLAIKTKYLFLNTSN